MANQATAWMHGGGNRLTGALGVGSAGVGEGVDAMFGAPAWATNSVLGQMAGGFPLLVVGPLFGVDWSPRTAWLGGAPSPGAVSGSPFVPERAPKRSTARATVPPDAGLVGTDAGLSLRGSVVGI